MSGNSILANVIGNLASYELHPLWVLLNQSAMRSEAVRSSRSPSMSRSSLRWCGGMRSRHSAAACPPGRSA